jgi:DNA-binding transcriptional LysR family regulator
MFTLEQVRGFVVVAEELHFGRAAERLQMTQPPLSRQIQKLERSMGVTLLERSNRGVELTPAGAVFLHEARRLVALAEAAPRSAQRMANGMAGRVAIGFTAMAAVSTLGPLLQQLADALPEVEVVLHELVSNAQTDALTQGTLDLALMRQPPTDRAFSSLLLHREPLLAALPVGHPLATVPGPIDVRDFGETDMIMYSREGAWYFDNLVTAILAGVRPRSIQRVVQVHSMMWLVAAGRGVAIVPSSAQGFNIAGVVFRPIKNHRTEIVELFATWRQDTSNPALLRVLALLTPITELDDPTPGGATSRASIHA